jgi:uncharacterized protein YcbK (DUF882 family)
MQTHFLELLDSLRDECGFPLIVTSGYRCPEHNAAVSSTGRTGPHTTGRAADLAVDGARAHALMTIALAMGFSGLGVNQKGPGRFLHVDDLPNASGQPRPTIWSY